MKNYYRDNAERKFTYYMDTSTFETVELKQKHLDKISKFFDLLEEFKFIRNGNDDVKIFSTDVGSINSQLSAEIAYA